MIISFLMHAIAPLTRNFLVFFPLKESTYLIYKIA